MTWFSITLIALLCFISFKRHARILNGLEKRINALEDKTGVNKYKPGTEIWDEVVAKKKND